MSIFRYVMTLIFGVVFFSGAYAQNDDDDAKITVEVQKRIDDRPSLKGLGITVRTTDHVVYLEGIVDTRVSRGEAGEIARETPGVKSVENGLTVPGE